MTVTDLAKRAGYAIGIVAFAFGIVVAAMPARASAYALLSSRYIQLSSSANAATNVIHKVGFTTVTNGQTIGSVVIEYCSNSPIIGDTCSAPTSFNTNKATLSVNNITGNITGLSVDTTDSTATKVVLTRSAATVANGAVTFELGDGTSNGMTNPANTNTTFYARISTFAATDGSGTAQDAGGVALSTDNQLSVTAKVQETLTFCVYTLANCAAGGTAVTLGDSNGVLASNTTVYTATAKYDLASNALSGVSVKLKGDILKSGSFSISSSGATCTADSSSSSTEQFGLRLSTVGSGQTATAPYNCSSTNHAFDTTNTNTTYGQQIASTTTASDSSSTTMEFAAKAASTTEAGVYTSTLTLIATATY